ALDEKMSRPAELVQRAKQLAQLANFQFGRNSVPTNPSAAAMAAAASAASAQSREEQDDDEGGGVALAEAPFAIATVTTAKPVAPARGAMEMKSAPVAMVAPAESKSMPAIADATKTTEQKLEEFYGVKQIGED